jgi:Condensation domain
MQESDFSNRIANLSPAKLELLLRQLGKRETSGASPQSIPRQRNAGDHFAPASFAQEGLWFLYQLEPESPAYNVTVTVRLEGLLDVSVLERSLSEVVKRHESLRTTFREDSGRLVQIVAPPQAFLPLSVVELTALPRAQREAEAARLAFQDSQRPFELTTESLIRAVILRLDEEEHVAILAMHHIISDAWSLSLLIQEIATFYESFSKGLPAPLPELSIQFADYACWQREQLQGQALESQLAYWMNQLRDLPPILDLPAGRQRLQNPSSQGARRFIKLSKELTGALKELSRREEATLFMTLLAAFLILLHRETRQEDILIGSPIANRTRPETETLIGLFVNTLVLRGDLSGNPSFRELVARVRETTLEADAHQSLPFDKLVKALQPDRAAGQMPLVQVAFTLRNNPPPILALPGLILRPVETDRSTVQFDLTLNFIEREQALVGAFEYKTDLFEAATIDRLWSHYERILETVVAGPQLRLSQIEEAIAEADRRQWDASKKELSAVRLQKAMKIKRKVFSGVQSKG